MALLGGEGHKAPVLAINFHPNGRWLLSGGIDTAVCLWAVPVLEQLERREEKDRLREPLIVYYPHFFTKELHPNYVDCLAFYGDLIISKAARDQESARGKGANLNEILLWRIEGFDSEASPAQDPPIPVSGQRTRSSFSHKDADDEDLRGFHRILTFNIPHTDRFYHRFGLLHSAGMRPILCMGTQQSKYLFWDLQRLEEGVSAQDRPIDKAGKTTKKQSRARKGHLLTGDVGSESEAASSSGVTRESRNYLGIS